MSKNLLLAATLLAFSTGASWSQGNGHITAEGVVIDESVDVVTTILQFMGMSMKAPPNDNAAKSRGVRTETTTTTTTTTTTADVTGPPGQINQGNYDCNNCVESNVDTQTTVETDTSVSGPGNSNSDE